MSAELELQNIFRAEAREELEKLGQGLMTLESASDAETRAEALREVFRIAHSLKGAAGAVDRGDFARVAHALETCLDELRRTQAAPSAALLDAALDTVDLLQRAVDRALESDEVTRAEGALFGTRAGAHPASSPAATPASPAKGPSSASGAQRSAMEELLDKLVSTLAHAAREPLDADAVGRLHATAGQLRDRPAGPPAFVRIASRLAAQLGRMAPGKVPDAELQAALLATDFLQSALAGAGSDDEAAVIEDLFAANERPAPAAAPVEAEAPAAAAAATAFARSEGAEASLRVPAALVDSIGHRVSELIASRLRLDHLRLQLEAAQEILARATAAARRDEAGPLEAVQRRLENVRRGVTEETHGLQTLGQSLQEDLADVRMVPVGPALEPLRRVVRDVARKLGKDAILEIGRTDVRVDRQLLDLLRDPLGHLLRNAVDHGVESPADRARTNKPARAVIRIDAESRDGVAWITVADDGRGIDRDRVRQTALQRGLVTDRDLQRLTDEELLALIFQPGFSTASEVSETSGRGVGLDVVRVNVGALGGRVHVESTPGAGSRFVLVLPLTLSATRGLLVSAGGHTYCVPLEVVQEVIGTSGEEVTLTQGRQALMYRNHPVAFARLEDLVSGRAGQRPQGRLYTVLMALGERRVAVGVEDVIGQQEVVIRALAAGSPELPLVAGATTLADGSLVTVLKPAELLAASVSAKAQASTSTRQRARTVLVADDSLTTRTLISGVLEGAGYRVVLAPDGEAAFAAIQRSAPDLVVSDVEMPGMTGLELVQRIRATPRYSAIPVVLVTSLASPEDKARAAAAGASGYFVKRNFDPPRFLELVAEQLGGGAAEVA